MKAKEVLELPNTVVQVLVVEDFTPWRVFIETHLGKVPNLRIIGTACDGLDAIQKAVALQPDLIVMDVSLPKLNGIAAAFQIRQHALKAAILFLSESSDPGVVRAALRVGGRGYVLKSQAKVDLVAALETVLGGKRFLSHGLVDHDRL